MTEDESILICAIRYVILRQNYVLSDRWVRARWRVMSAQARATVIDDLSEAITAALAIRGSTMDARVWRNLYVWAINHSDDAIEVVP